jgi:hypothetical protein
MFHFYIVSSKVKHLSNKPNDDMMEQWALHSMDDLAPQHRFQKMNLSKMEWHDGRYTSFFNEVLSLANETRFDMGLVGVGRHYNGLRRHHR